MIDILATDTAAVDTLAVDVGETTDNVVDWLVTTGLRVLIFVVIVLVGWMISRALYRITARLLDRVGFNRLAERSGIRRWTGDYQASDLVAKIVYYGLLLLTLRLGFDVFGPNPVSTLLDRIVAWLPRLLVAVVILVVAAAIANAVFDIVHNALEQLPYGRMLGRIGQVVILALGVIAALNTVGLATTVTGPVLVAILATIAGILIVGVGGGLVQPMASRWERMLGKAEAEGSRAAQHMRENAQRRQQGQGGGFGQPAYQGRTGGQAQQDVQRAAEQAGQSARQQPQQQQQPGR